MTGVQTCALPISEEIGEKQVVLQVKAGTDGRIFGSVSTKEIAKAAKEQLGLELDKKKMQLEDPIKMCGVTVVPVKLHRDVTAKLSVKVTEA